jgi:hypothetical protein
VAEITGMENVHAATITGKHGDKLELDWDGQKMYGTAGCGHVGNVVTFTVHPHDVHMASDWDGGDLGINMFRGCVERVRPYGYNQLVSVRVGQASVLQALAPVHQAVMPGVEVLVTVPPHAVWMMTD